jgi:hypothetical protein
LAPVLNQSFFVGDGQTSTGTVQQFDVPTGATELYLGIQDSYNFGWSSGMDPGYYDDNTGGFTATVSVPEPSSFALVLLTALISIVAVRSGRKGGRAPIATHCS